MISDIVPKKEYTGNGVTKIFSFPYPYFDSTHVTVYRKVISTEAVSVVPTSEYTLPDTGTPDGGDTAFAVAPTADHFITILRDAVPLSQTADYVTGEGFPADAHEAQQDKAMMVLQQFREQLARCPTVAAGSGAGGEELTDQIQLSITQTAAAQAAAEVAQTASESARDAAVAAKDLAVAAAASIDDYASQAEAEAGTAEDKQMNPLRTAQAIAALGLPGVRVAWGQLSKNISEASVNTAYTGVGFTPKAVFFLSAIYGAYSVGMGVAGAENKGASFSGVTAAPVGSSDACINLVEVGGSGDYSYATIASLDADGFTLAWVRSGTPVGTRTVSYLAIG